MVIILTFIALTFTFYAPLYLYKRSGKIRPTKNMFENFIESDQGYPWSIDEKRKKSYRKALEKKIKENRDLRI